MNKEINISILSDVIANKVVDSCNLNVNKQKIIANIISEALDEYTIQRNVPISTEIEIQIHNLEVEKLTGKKNLSSIAI